MKKQKVYNCITVTACAMLQSLILEVHFMLHVALVEQMCK